MSAGHTIYCDFDGTITKDDYVNNFFSDYADSRWLEVEEQWIQGKIGSRECMQKQVELLRNMPIDELNRFINTIEIDEYFIDFYNHVKRLGMKLVILSDGFDLFIQKTLERNNLTDISYFSNSLIYKDSEFSIEFNNYNPDCSRNSGTCKCSQVKEDSFYYIGDGLSDSCIAKKAKVLFAKNNLQNFCDKNKIKYIKFETFNDILNYFISKGELNAQFDYVNI